MERLPDRERQAVVLRFWYDASETEIAEALGGVTTRTVRNILTRAYARLRGGYQPDGYQYDAARHAARATTR